MFQVVEACYWVSISDVCDEHRSEENKLPSVDSVLNTARISRGPIEATLAKPQMDRSNEPNYWIINITLGVEESRQLRVDPMERREEHTNVATMND